ncbi:MAG: response regulator [Planctomycetaceae bacterium]|jgi:two-component system chemotaxis response regulator CheY|nr:response regulator [Planctomycetaceae bacterium]
MPSEITNDLLTNSVLPSQKIKEILPPSPQAFIVDDSIPTRRIFRNILEELGFKVNEAVNGKVALEKLQEVLPETMIIFSDISMPVMDGFEFCFRLMQERWYDGTPFVLVSTESDAKNVIKGLKLGADDFLPKPFDKEIVSLVLLRILQ